MSRLEQHIEDRLLAYHMGWLDRLECEEVERLIAESPEAAARSRELQATLAPLADFNALPVVEDLEVQILRRVQRETGASFVPVAKDVRLNPVPSDGGRILRFPLSPRELMVVAASVAIILTLVVPGFGKAAALAQRSACAENLRQIGQALGQYGFDNNSQLPYAAQPHPGGNWLADQGAGYRRLRNSGNRFRLLAQGFLPDSSRYVCPADRQGLIMQVDDLSLFNDFAEPRNCSYDSQIMFGAGQRVSEHPQKVVYADSNPLFDPLSSSALESEQLNSAVHSRLSGQNVLRLDQSAAWTTSPNVGVQNDNIWQIGDRSRYAGSEFPQLATDSFLIP
ncbi:MAG: hypothetical protein IID41_12360 [Planctomycetes bacterium]|nr:hypothetical protein [Planctomycetota bacterium]